MSTTLPASVEQFFTASNAGDTEAFIAAFTDDALLNDSGREFVGRDEITSWNDTENVGVQTTFAVGGFDEGPGAVTVDVRVSGNGYNGPATFIFVLRDDRISHLLIA